MLPVINTPKYKLPLLGIKKDIEYRPFLVKEQKVLLMAKESRDDDQKISATVDVLNSCTLGKVDVENLPIFDIELLFINIRARSVGDEVDFKFEYTSEEGKKEIVSCHFSLFDVKVKTNKDHKEIIDISDGYKVKMKYPTIRTINTIQNGDDDLIIATHIDMIINGDEIIDTSDIPLEDIVDWVSELSIEDGKALSKFFVTMPTIEHELEIKTSAGIKKKTLRGMKDFF